MRKLTLVFALVAMTVISCNTKQKKDNSDANMSQDTTATTDTNMAADDSMADDQTVADIAMSNDNFSTLVTAIKAADLGATLQGEGPYTVFAPTNDAFNKLPKGTVDELVKPENKEKLTGILTYHVVPGKFMAADVVKAIKDNNGKYEITTVEGDKITASLDGDTVVLTDAGGNKANVTMTDIDGSNGVIHAIDAVLMPSK